MQSRRRFLRLATAAVAAPCLAATFGKPTFKLSLAAYSMRQFLDAKAKADRRMDLFGFLDYCAKLSVQGVEPTSYYFPKEYPGAVDTAFLNALKRRAQELKLEFSAGAIRNDFCQRPGPKLDEDRTRCVQWLGHYKELGVRPIRIFAGNTPKGDSEGDAIRRCIAVIDEMCGIAEKYGAILALENHGGVTSKVETILEIVRAVKKSPAFGVNLDSGNFRDGADPYADLAKIAPFAVNAQIKVDVARTVDGKSKTEETDYRKVVQILKDAGYTGWVALEYEGKEDPYKGIPKALDKMRNAFAAEGV